MKIAKILKSLTLGISVLIIIHSSMFSFALNQGDLNAETAILLDSDGGQILFEKNAHQSMFPASTTKVMTALLILENHALDEIVTVDAKSPFATGSRIYVIEGETFTVEQLLYALMLASANDVAETLARFDAGTVEAFAEKMNTRAAELGALNTHFTNPHGLPDPNHTTTAYDLAMIAKEAIKYEKLREIAKTPFYEIQPTNKQPEVRRVSNSNRFLSGRGPGNRIDYKGATIDIMYEAITGLKTGYTNAAQQCFISTATKDGENLISVIMKAQGNFLYIDSRTLIDYGFDQYNAYDFAKKNTLIDTFEYEGNKKIKIPLYSQGDIRAMIPVGFDISSFTKVIEIDPNLTLPLKEGQQVGLVRYKSGDNILAEAPLVTLNAISDRAALGETTLMNTTWLRFDTSPKAMTVLGLKVTLSLGLWRFIMRFLSPRKKRVKKTMHPSESVHSLGQVSINKSTVRETRKRR